MGVSPVTHNAEMLVLLAGPSILRLGLHELIEGFLMQRDDGTLMVEELHLGELSLDVVLEVFEGTAIGVGLGGLGVGLAESGRHFD